MAEAWCLEYENEGFFGAVDTVAMLLTWLT